VQARAVEEADRAQLALPPKLADYLTVRSLAARKFGSDEKAVVWLTTANPRFGGRTPLDVVMPREQALKGDVGACKRVLAGSGRIVVTMAPVTATL
jgi:uncharacterized protein (DUF2384 family)